MAVQQGTSAQVRGLPYLYLEEVEKTEQWSVHSSSQLRIWE